MLNQPIKSNNGVGTLNLVLICIILFGFNWKLVVEIIEIKYEAPTILQIWLVLVAIGINGVMSFIKDEFIRRYYKVINVLLMLCCLLSIGLPLGQRWEFALFFLYILIQFEHKLHYNDIQHRDMPKLLYLLGALGLSVVLVFVPTLLQDFPDYSPKACGCLFCSILYCLYRAIQAMRKDHYSYSHYGTESVIYLVLHITSVTIPTLLIFCFLEDRHILDEWTDQIHFLVSLALIIRFLNFLLEKQKSDEISEKAYLGAVLVEK